MVIVEVVRTTLSWINFPGKSEQDFKVGIVDEGFFGKIFLIIKG